MIGGSASTRLRNALLSLGLGAIAAAVFFGAASANAAGFGIESFGGEVKNADGSPAREAGGHPFEATTSIVFNHHIEAGFGETPVPDGDVKDIEVDLPPGFIGNPGAVPKCKEERLQTGNLDCPGSTQVGIAINKFSAPYETYHSPIYNMEPPPGLPAQFGMNLVGVVVHMNVRLRTDGTYAVSVDTSNISQSNDLWGTEVRFWGVPGEELHDELRTPCVSQFGPSGQKCPSTSLATAFLTSPMDCSAGPLTTTMRADSWESPGAFHTRSFDRDVNGVPFAVEGCEGLPFSPQLTAAPTGSTADAPTGLNVVLSFARAGLESPTGTAAAPLKQARVTLPEGLTINPSAAAGLAACADEGLGLKTDRPLGCPEAARIGTATARTPLLDETLSGSLYLRTQASSDPSSGEMFRLALVLENPERGIDIRLPGAAVVNPDTGRIEAVFDNNPQLPVDEVALQLKGGPRAPLAMPQECGTKTITARLTSWGGQVAELSDQFEIPCHGTVPFRPSLEAGTVNPIAGATSPFAMRLTRNEGEETLGALSVKLPAGLTAFLRGVPYCPETTIAAAAAKSGAAEIASPACPAASQIGTAEVGAGSGAPYWVDGKAYLAGPYKGAPLSLVVVTPAVAGPFDLGTVIVRTALNVHPETAQITAVSDPLPQVVKGVPLRLRAVNVSIDRPAFTLNPTDCAQGAVEGLITSGQGTNAQASTRFQVGACERLAFKPKLALRFSGAPTRRGGYPKLTATLRMPKGGANIEKAVVTMPKTQFLENAHIRTICTRVQYAAKACPKASVYGYAKAWTPLLDEPLQGPVYLRSSSNELPDLVADLDGQIEIDLVGRIDAVRERIRNTFLTVPDAPVSKFQLTMQGGRKGLLVNNTDICKTKPIASVRFDGQNGKVAAAKPRVKVAGCGKAKKRGAKKRR